MILKRHIAFSHSTSPTPQSVTRWEVYMNPCSNCIQRHTRVFKYSRAELSVCHACKVRIHPPGSLPGSMHRLPAVDTMHNKVPPVRPADLTSLGHLVVGQLMCGSLIRIEFPRPKIHKLFVEILIKALRRLPGECDQFGVLTMLWKTYHAIDMISKMHPFSLASAAV